MLLAQIADLGGRRFTARIARAELGLVHLWGLLDSWRSQRRERLCGAFPTVGRSPDIGNVLEFGRTGK